MSRRILALVAVLVGLAGVALSQTQAQETMTLCPMECWSYGCGEVLDIVNWGEGHTEVPGGIICHYEDVDGNRFNLLMYE